VKTAQAWKGHCTRHHDGVLHDAIVYDPSAKGAVEASEEFEEEYEDASDPVVDAINELKEQMSELTLVVKMLAKSIPAMQTTSVNAMSTPKRPSSVVGKTPVKRGSAPVDIHRVSLEGVMEDARLIPSGKIKLNHESTFRVVYSNKDKLVYYSPKKDTGDLTVRVMNQVQIQRIEDLTANELDFLGYDEPLN
jgi:predicted transcriptional regulator